MRWIPGLLALAVLAGCSSSGDEPKVPSTAPVSASSTPTPSVVVVSERPRPKCQPVSQSELGRLAEGVAGDAITVAKGAGIELPNRLRKRGYTTLVGVRLAGPGVDGRGATLAVGSKNVAPLPVDDLARNTFTGLAKVKAGSDLDDYRAQLARSESALDALACAAQ